MDWITEQVAIGNYLEAQDAELLLAHAFRSVLSLDGSLSSRRAAELGLSEIVGFKLIDGAGNDPRHYESAVDALLRLVRSKPPVLVHCHAGRSRSAIVVAGFLVASQGIEPDAALAHVAAKREVNVSEGLRPLLDRIKKSS
jgi:protein-tyrosine phosphatase